MPKTFPYRDTNIQLELQEGDTVECRNGDEYVIRRNRNQDSAYVWLSNDMSWTEDGLWFEKATNPTDCDIVKIVDRPGFDPEKKEEPVENKTRSKDEHYYLIRLPNPPVGFKYKYEAFSLDGNAPGLRCIVRRRPRKGDWYLGSDNTTVQATFDRKTLQFIILEPVTPKRPAPEGFEYKMTEDGRHEFRTPSNPGEYYLDRYEAGVKRVAVDANPDEAVDDPCFILVEKEPVCPVGFKLVRTLDTDEPLKREPLPGEWYLDENGKPHYKSHNPYNDRFILTKE